jgi:hypothetical protein
MSVIEKFTVCTDCYMAAAGYTPEELGYTPESEPLTRIEFQVVVPDHDGDPHYGKYPCEGCGSRLEGNRLEVSAWNHD